MVLIKDSLEGLDYLEEQTNCSTSVKDEIQTLKMELKFLRTFVRGIGVIMFDDRSLSDRFLKIKAVIQDVREVILSLYAEAKEDGKVPKNFERWLFYMLKKIELIKPQVNRCYHRISSLSRSVYGTCCSMAKFVHYVLENLKDLLQSEVNSNVLENKLLGTVERRLRFLRNSLQFMDKLRIDDENHVQHLLDDAVNVAGTAASFLFSCWINLMDENKEPERKFELYRALNYKSDGEETSLYRGVLEASKSLTSDDADEFLMGLIDFLLEYLGEILDGNLEIPTRDLFVILHEELKLQRVLLMATGMQYADYKESFLKRIGAQVNKLVYIIELLNAMEFDDETFYNYYRGRMDEETFEDSYVGDVEEEMMTITDNYRLLHLRERLKLIKSFVLIELVNYGACMLATMKDQFRTLSADMQLLKTFLIDTRKGYNVDEKLKDIHSHIEVVAIEAGSAMYSFYNNETKEDMAEMMSSLLPDLLEKMKLIKADMRKIYPRATSYNFPKTRGQRGTAIFLRELNELLKSRAETVSHFVKPHMEEAAKLWIENVQNELEFLISFLESSEEKWIEIEELEALDKCIIYVANEAKYATDPIFLRDHPVWYCILKFSHLMEEVKLIKEEIERIKEKISREKLSAMREVIVGFEDEAKNVIEQLIGGPEQLNIISVIGMGGLGKTTLAKKLYSNPSVVEYFDVRAWCCVSQLFQKRQVLLDILSHVVEDSKDINEGSDEDLAKRLFQSLKGRRYLIVIDDIWDVEAWNAIKRCFQNEKNGSRIIFTTRLQEIASKVQEHSIPYLLRPFNDDESWELLQKKLFLGKRCPTEEQLEIVKKIAKNCKGLPLAVVLMAGVLVKKKEEEWKQVAKSLSQHTDGDLQNLSMKVLELSYRNLPNHLRLCFLYLGAFPEDKEIQAKKLMWLWAAEGFIEKTEERSLEDTAEDYLMDLISRSLVIVAERGSRGGVKTFRIHDLLRSLSLDQAKKEKFLLMLDGNDEPFAPTNLKSSNPITHEQYRLCIHSMSNEFKKWPSDLPVHSLLHFAPAFHLDMTSPYDASSIFSIFKSLNILDLGRLVLEDLNPVIELLVLLRLLAVRIQSNTIPSSIANLGNLEVFLVKGMRGEVSIPNTIWSMVSLRHLHIDNRAAFIWEKSDVNNVLLDKLETLSTPILSYGRIQGM